MIQRRIIKEDDSIQLGHHTSLDSYFKDTVYEGNIFGNEKSLKLIKKKDIVHFYKKYFKAGNMILSVSSNIEKELLMEILQKYFSRFPKGTSTVIQTASGSIPENKTINVKKDSKQSFISLSFLLPELTQRNFILSFMLKYFLGKGPGSKLWELREERNLAYNVNCRVTWMKGGGILEVYIESDRCKKDISLQAINKIITDLYKNGITKEEFTEMKTYAKSSFLRSIETKNKRTYYMAFFEAMGLSHKFITLFLKEIDSVSLVDTNNYINKILVPSKMVEIIIGPGYYEEQT
jgi:predicted Zn-dependent peptidase